MIGNQEEKILVSLKENIHKRLTQLGKTMKELVTDIEMSEPGLYKMFSNGSMKIKTLIKIADVLEMPIEYFFQTKDYSSVTQHQILEEQNAVYHTNNKILDELEIIKKQNQEILNGLK